MRLQEVKPWVKKQIYYQILIYLYVAKEKNQSPGW